MKLMAKKNTRRLVFFHDRFSLGGTRGLDRRLGVSVQ